MKEASGLAASIRNAVESETFDLGGSTSATIHTIISNAFSEPFPHLPSMIRLTFVTGAGKLGRAKYDEGAAKAVTGALRDLGYTEDRGASAVMECAGSFKLQHDTGKNLKTVVVFPKMMEASGGGSIANGMGGMSLQPASLLEENSIEHKIAMASKATFSKMLESKCPTWSQKKGCSLALAELKSMADAIDQKLLSGQPLDDAEQEFYDNLSISSLEEKIVETRTAMQAMVDAGNINTYDYKVLVEQVTERLSTFETDIAEAKREGKPKRVQNLQTAKQKAEARKDKIKSLHPCTLPPLRNESAIAKLRKEMEPILAMESAAKGRLLTLKESQSVTHKEELMEEVFELQDASRGWFESDELFSARMEASNAAWESTRRKASKKKAAGGGTAAKSSTAAKPIRFVTGTKKAGWSSAKPSKPAVKATPGGLFAAMMEDSSDDSD